MGPDATTTEYWWSTAPPLEPAGLARRLADDGWDGLVLSDSQHLAPDTFVVLAAAAMETAGRGFGLGTGVTNPVTRHPAVAVGAAATVAMLNGRTTVLGVGRGDSAMHSLGRPPAPVSELERFLAAAAAYLRGEGPGDGSDPLGWTKSFGSRRPDVVLDVAATGPKVIAAASRHADLVTFAVGADSERLRDAIALARAERPAGMSPLRFGAYVNVAAHPDPALARRVVQGRASTFARFSTVGRAAHPDAPERDRAALDALAAAYTFAGHGDARAAHAAALDDTFLSRFAIFGPPATCVDRIAALVEGLPLERVVVASGHRGVEPSVREEVAACFAADVLPHLPR